MQQANAVAVEQRLQREKGSWVLENRAVVPREFLQVSRTALSPAITHLLINPHLMLDLGCKAAALTHLCAAPRLLVCPPLQHCILPRMLNSPADALYCARFLK